MFPGQRWKGLSWASCGILGEKGKGIAALCKWVIFSCVVVFCFHFFFFLVIRMWLENFPP